MRDAIYYRNFGSFFQIPMLITLFVLIYLYGSNGEFSWLHKLFALVGTLSILIFLLQIYMPRILKRGEKGKLITSGLFSITRHPMYHGIFIGSWSVLSHKNIDEQVFVALYSIFFVFLITAGWFQEKETIARWGDETKRYYRRTPRFVIEWIWFWKIRS